jgi:hypothetical protein
MKPTRGSTLIELLLYTGLLTTILVVLYQLFTLAAYRKIDEIVEDELYVTASRMIADLNRTVQQATIISEPIAGGSSDTLSLNGGTTIYQLDEDNRLVKLENGTTAFMTGEDVTLENLTFIRRGPSVESQTITTNFTVVGNHEVQGEASTEDFTTSITVR